MIVVSDTTPLNYLILIDCENVLFELFGRVIIPQAVADEISAPGAPAKVQQWANELPQWVEIKETSLIADESLRNLDAGETEAILLARELLADVLLVDDGQARFVAANLGIPITGTLGILDRAAAENLIDLAKTLEALQETSFHVSQALIEKLLSDDRARGNE